MHFAAHAIDSTSASHLMKLLVVDDNVDSADSLGMLLDCLGADVTVVYDGASALDIYESLQPTAVILDLGMPGMDGCEVARRLRKRDSSAMLIALTGWGGKEDLERTRKAGFNHHWVKPLKVEALEETLGSLRG